MLIGPTHFAIKTPVELSRDATQILIDAEVFFVSLGLSMDLRCISCMRVGDSDGAYCQGSANDAHDEFTVECACSRRVGKGAFTVPAEPKIPAHREPLADGAKRTERLTRAQVTDIDAFERVLKSLKLQYLLRCLRCRMADLPDGIKGVAEKANMVLECACTKRIGDVVTLA